MKVLWLSHLLPYPPKAGVLQRSYHLVHELARHHEVDVLAFNQPALLAPIFDSVEAGVEEGMRVVGEYCRRVELVDIPSEAHRFGNHLLALRSLFTRLPYTVNWLGSRDFADRLNDWIADTDYDLVHFDTISLVPYRAQVGDVPCVLDHHNIESHLLIRRAGIEPSRLRAWYYRQEGERLERYEREVCPGFELNVTCSQMDSERLQSFCPEARCEVVPNGVDVGYFEPAETAPARQDPSLVFVGTLSWFPNTEAVRFLAHEVWPELRDRFPDLVVDIVGAHPPADLVELGARDPRFRIHGFVDDIRPLIARAAAYLCPIRDGGGTKLKILDALAMGKALIAHPIACEGIDVEDGRSVLLASSPEDFAEHVARVLAEPELGAALGREARALATRSYSYASIGEQMARIYADLAGSA